MSTKNNKSKTLGVILAIAIVAIGAVAIYTNQQNSGNKTPLEIQTAQRGSQKTLDAQALTLDLIPGYEDVIEYDPNENNYTMTITPQFIIKNNGDTSISSFSYRFYEKGAQVNRIIETKNWSSNKNPIVKEATKIFNLASVSFNLNDLAFGDRRYGVDVYLVNRGAIEQNTDNNTIVANLTINEIQNQNLDDDDLEQQGD